MVLNATLHHRQLLHPASAGRNISSRRGGRRHGRGADTRKFFCRPPPRVPIQRLQASRAADTWSGCRGDDNTSRRTAASPFDAHMGARKRALTLSSQASFSGCAGNFLLENFAAAGNASGRAADVKVKRARAGSADIDPRPAPMSLRQICHSSPTPPRRCFRRARRVPSRPAALSDLRGICLGPDSAGHSFHCQFSRAQRTRSQTRCSLKPRDEMAADLALFIPPFTSSMKHS